MPLVPRNLDDRMCVLVYTVLMCMCVCVCYLSYIDHPAAQSRPVWPQPFAAGLHDVLVAASHSDSWHRARPSAEKMQAPSKCDGTNSHFFKATVFELTLFVKKHGFASRNVLSEHNEMFGCRILGPEMCFKIKHGSIKHIWIHEAKVNTNTTVLSCSRSLWL